MKNEEFFIPNSSFKELFSGFNHGWLMILRVTPEIHFRDFVNTGNRAVIGTGFRGIVLADNIVTGVIFKGDSRVASLLGAIVNQPIFTDVEVPGASSTFPLVGASFGQGILKLSNLRMAGLSDFFQLPVHFGFVGGEWLEMTVAIMDDANRD